MKWAIWVLCVALAGCTFNETTIIQSPEGGEDTGVDPEDVPVEDDEPDVESPEEDASEPDMVPDASPEMVVEDVGPEDVPEGMEDVAPPEEDTPGDGRPRSGELSFVEIEAPEDGSALRLGALALGDFVVDPDEMVCAPGVGAWAFADAFRVRNNSGHTLQIRIAASTVRDAPSFTLPEVAVYLYNEGALARDPGACSRVGLPADDHASALATFPMPAGLAVEVLVVGGGPDVVGTYALTVYHEGGGPDPDPDPQPDMEPDDVPPGFLCTDTCRFAGDMVCDDGGEDARFRECEYGTDCEDCGPRDPDSGCLNTCHTSSDDVCDDGGPGSEYSICDLGTDCEDCGTR